MTNQSKKILFVCSTPFQIMVATQIYTHSFSHAMADIILTDHVKDYQKLIDGLKKTSIFKNVYLIKCKKTIKHSNSPFSEISYTIRRTKEILFDWLKSIYFAHNKTYDDLFITNISILTIFIYNTFLKTNPNIKLNIFEEGMSTYCHSYTDADKPSSLHRRFVNKSGIINNTYGLWVFRPELLQWSLPNGKIFKISAFNTHDESFLNIVNTIFNIKQLKDDYSEKIIFFEEAFYQDGININDEEIVKKLIDIYGKENILVKLHPRNAINRFAKLGIKTNIDTSIPWEALILNKDFSDKILITISSGSTLYPCLYFNLKTRCVSLLSCLEERPGWMNGELGDIMIKAYKMYPDVFFLPNSFEELKESVKI